MANYHELNYIMDNMIFEKILRNQNICKLLACYPDKIMARPEEYDDEIEYNEWNYDPLSQPDIPDTTRKLFMWGVYPLPKMPDAKTKQRCYMCVTFSGGYEPEVNLAFKSVNLFFDIICHLDSWKISDGYRPFSIMYEINSMINNLVTDLPIINKPELVGFQARDYSHYFYGLQLKYNLILNTNIVCPQIPKNIDFAPRPPVDDSFITEN